MEKKIKSILLSIKPEFVEMIFSGCKTVELRRVLPKYILEETEIIIYATSPIKCIVGKAIVKKIEKSSPTKMWKNFGAKTGISQKFFRTYFSGQELSYGLVLYKVRKLETPLPLEELRNEIDFNPPQSFMYAPEALLEILR